MSRKILFRALVLCGLVLGGEIHAFLLSQKMPQFYAGLSVGAQRLSGRRSEVANYAASPGDPFGPPEVINFSNLSPFSNKNGYYSGHVGCTWGIPRTTLFWGPEIYIGQSNTRNNVIKSFLDLTASSRSLNASIRQSNFFGGAFQVGFNWIGNSRLSLLLGFEKSQFEYFGVYVPRSQFALVGFNPGGPGIGDDYAPTILNTSKWLSGFMWGLGIERQIESFRIGVDFRMIHYKEFKAAYTVLAAEPETLYTAIKPKNIRFGLKFSYLF